MSISSEPKWEDVTGENLTLKSLITVPHCILVRMIKFMRMRCAGPVAYVRTHSGYLFVELYEKRHGHFYSRRY